MIKCATSLWSADLGNLAAEMKRVEHFSEKFHLDVADGHYVKTLLFFPDLVRALRPHTKRPFEVHLMTTEPLDWIEPFCEAGADGFIVCFDSAREPGAVIEAIKTQRKSVGFSLTLDEPLELLDPYWQDIDVVTIVGTAMGIKGAPMDASVPEKVSLARSIITERRLKTEIEVDGGIRRLSVPLVGRAGTDWIVPGSLMFGADPIEMRRWLANI